MASSNQLPTIFQEKQRGYTLNIHPEGGAAIAVASAEACLRAMHPFPDNTTFTIDAKYQEEIIGIGRYRKQGLAGQLHAVEALEASGAMMGILETALARRRASQQETVQAERLARLVILPCTCGQDVGYDPQEQTFTTLLGRSIITCPACKALLSLETIEHSLQQHMQVLQEELRQQQEQLNQVAALRRESAAEN